MSMVAIGKTPFGIAVAADTAAYRLDGVVKSVFAPKIRVWPMLNMVVCHIGSQPLGMYFNDGLMTHQPTSFDETLKVAEHLFIEGFLQDQSDRPEVGWEYWRGRVLIAGLSEERGQYEIYKLWTGVGENEPDAFKLIEIPHPFYGACGGDAFLDRHGATEELFARTGEDPNAMVEYCVRAICAARQTSGFAGREVRDGYWGAGGAIECAFVSPQSAQQWIRHRWKEDEVNKPIDLKASAIGPADLYPPDDAGEARQ